MAYFLSGASKRVTSRDRHSDPVGPTMLPTLFEGTRDPDARLCKKTTGSEAKLASLGHLLMENRHGLIGKRF